MTKIEVITLQPGQKPPEDADWVMVTADRAGRYQGSGSVVDGNSATFYVPHPSQFADLYAAVDDAKAWAETHGVPKVYVSP